MGNIIISDWSKKLKERMKFFVNFLKHPRKIGSITPSSSFLTKKMLGDLSWSDVETIVELGAGTGVFTEYIAQNISDDCKVVIFEQDFTMKEALQTKYPSFLYADRAEKIKDLFTVFNLPKADCIISGLPFAILPKRLRAKIILRSHDCLSEDGVFVAFQYSLQMYGMLKRTFSHVEVSFVPLNVPPAFVFYCKK